MKDPAQMKIDDATRILVRIAGEQATSFMAGAIAVVLLFVFALAP